MAGEILEQIEKIAAFGAEIPSWRAGIDTAGGAEGGFGLAAIAFDLVDRIADEFDETVRRIESDPDLSPVGRRRKIETFADETRARLGVARRHVERLAEEVEALLGGADAEPRTSDTIKAAIWRWLERLDPLQVELAYRQALAAGDLATTDAIESLPAVHPARPAAERLAELRSQRIRTVNPEAAGKAAALDRAVRDVIERADVLERRLAELTGDAPDAGS